LLDRLELRSPICMVGERKRYFTLGTLLRMASWKKPGRAVRVVVHEEEGEPRYYWRHEDAGGKTAWRKDAPLAGESASGEELTTVELVEAVEASLTERRHASRGRKLRMPFR
jgi:hypothetical protein